MAFITAYLRNVSKHLNFLLLAVELVFPALLQAAEIEVVNQQIVASQSNSNLPIVLSRIDSPVPGINGWSASKFFVFVRCHAGFFPGPWLAGDR